MTSRTRIVYLVGFLVGLTVLNFVVAKGFTIPVGDTALWLHSGLLTLVLGAYWIESHFPSPGMLR